MVTLDEADVTTIPALMAPVTTRPTGTVPITFLDFTGVVQDDDLGVESFGRESWVFLAV